MIDAEEVIKNMTEDIFYRALSFIANKAILMTLMPSLFLNVVIDATKGLLEFKTRAGKVIVLNGLLSLLGLVFGFIYHFLLQLPLDECLLHSVSIVGVSYLLYYIKVYHLFKAIIDKLKTKFGVSNE